MFPPMNVWFTFWEMRQLLRDWMMQNGARYEMRLSLNLKGRPAAGIISAIMMAGDLLGGAFPRDGVGGSRFADELVILDQ